MYISHEPMTSLQRRTSGRSEAPVASSWTGMARGRVSWLAPLKKLDGFFLRQRRSGWFVSGSTTWSWAGTPSGVSSGVELLDFSPEQLDVGARVDSLDDPGLPSGIFWLCKGFPSMTTEGRFWYCCLFLVTSWLETGRFGVGSGVGMSMILSMGCVSTLSTAEADEDFGLTCPATTKIRINLYMFYLCLWCV